VVTNNWSNTDGMCIVDISLYRFAHINFLGIAWSAYVFGLLGIFLAEIGAEIPEEE
jgi:membrane protein DedA with SNARE-associated domain